MFTSPPPLTKTAFLRKDRSWLISAYPRTSMRRNPLYSLVSASFRVVAEFTKQWGCVIPTTVNPFAAVR